MDDQGVLKLTQKYEIFTNQPSKPVKFPAQAESDKDESQQSDLIDLKSDERQIEERQ